MTQTILYGAGGYAEKHLDSWLREGITPACFADKDEGKNGTFLCGYEVLPLPEALARFPDYDIKIAVDPRSYGKIAEYLCDCGVSQERISFAEKQYEYRYGCNQLGHAFWVSDESFRLCCHYNRKYKDYFAVPYNSAIDGLEKANKRCSEIMDLHRRGVPGQCEGCTFLQKSLYKTQTVRDIHITQCKGDVCNLRCVYCIAWPTMNINRQRDLKALLTELCTAYQGIPFNCTFVNGEFFARGDADEILEYLEDKECTISFTSNGTVFSERLLKMIRSDKAKVKQIVCSLDAGTRQTYKKIRGQDYFDNVLTNLKQYSEAGLYITLKYIFLPGANDNQADFEGFANAAEHIGAKRTRITANQNEKHIPLSAEAVEAVCGFYNMLKNRGLNVDIDTGFFNTETGGLINAKLK
jgi:pyruvate-formate lyase-activating enzyme